jgi:hypothetical protein
LKTLLGGGFDEDVGVPPPFRWQKDAAGMRQKWGRELLPDPFHNPNLGITIEDLFDPAFPPRIGMLDHVGRRRK